MMSVGAGIRLRVNLTGTDVNHGTSGPEAVSSIRKTAVMVHTRSNGEMTD